MRTSESPSCPSTSSRERPVVADRHSRRRRSGPRGAGVDARGPLDRPRLVATAAEIIGTMGVHSLSMRGLARALGCHPGALYHHVRSRREIVDSVAVCWGDALVADLAAASAEVGSPALALAGVLDGLLRVADETPNVWELLFLIDASDGVSEWWRRLAKLVESLCAASRHTHAGRAVGLDRAALVSLAIAVGQGCRCACRPQSPRPALRGKEIVEMTLLPRNA